MAQRTQTEMQVRGRAMLCGNVPQEIDAGLELIPKERGMRTPGFPLILDDLLPQVGDEKETVVLVVASAAQKELVASFACRLKELQINLLVSALDEEMFTCLHHVERLRKEALNLRAPLWGSSFAFECLWRRRRSCSKSNWPHVVIEVITCTKRNDLNFVEKSLNDSLNRLRRLA